MPTHNEIQTEIVDTQALASDNTRRKYLKKLYGYTKKDTILYFSGFTHKTNVPSQLLSIGNDDMSGFMSALNGLKGTELDLILHSPGGTLSAAEQIVNYLRSKYQKIRAIIPQNAMSAATMIACAADEIIMGKHSALGPIDPQMGFITPSGQVHQSPAQLILDEFDEMKEQLKNDPSTAPFWISKFRDYPIGFLNICKENIKLSKEKVAVWLESYMLKGDPDSKTKSVEIANWLGEFSNHRSHGRPLSISELKNQGLKVTYLEDDQKLQEHVLSVFHASIVTFQITTCVKFVENHNGKGLFKQFKAPKN